MRRVLTPAHATFSAANRTISFVTTVPASISHILKVTNLTRAEVLFDPTAESGLGYLSSATYASPVLTLAVSTEGMADNDRLFIEYDDGLGGGGGGASGEVTVLGSVEINNDTGNPIPMSDANGSVTVDGKSYRSTVSITRPSNTTQYTAGDVIGVADGGTPANAGSAIHTLTNFGPSGGMVLIQSAALIFSDAAVISGMSGFRVHLYQTSPTAILDNAAFDLVSGDRVRYMGFFEMPSPLDLGSTIYSQSDYIGRLVRLNAGSTSIFAEIETRGTYTPASGSTIELRVSTLEASL